MSTIWNFLIYLSPLILSTLLWRFSSLQKTIEYKDTNFTMSWSIATLAAGLILSNLPQENKWVLRIKKTKGLFIRLSLFLMSPTIYGLIHYSLGQVKERGCFLEPIYFISYISTLLSIILTVGFLGSIAYLIHDNN